MTLSDEMFFVFPLFNGNENRYLEYQYLFGFTGSTAAVASNVSAHQLRNPAGSNVIATFTKIALFPQNAAGTVNFSIGAQATDIATPIALTSVRFDPRGNPQPSIVYSQQNTTPSLAGLANTFFVGQQSSTFTQDCVLFEDEEITLLPGDAIRVVTSAVNQALQIIVMWRERFLEDSERA